MVLVPSQADFGFKIDFVKDTEDPSRIFRSFSLIIDFCQSTDSLLLKSLDVDIEPILLLEDIQQGSIIIWLKSSFEQIDQELIKKISPTALGRYLIKAKEEIISFLNQRSTLTNKSEISNLQTKLVSLAEELNYNKLSVCTPISQKELLSSIDKYQQALSELKEGDEVYYITRTTTLSLNPSFSISSQSMEDLLVDKTLRSDELEMILKIKKPDYLGDSKWQFKHGRKTIEAKVNDIEWLTSFKERKIFIAPGDAIKTKVEVVTKYDINNEPISTQYTILKVIEVIPSVVSNQLSLFSDKDLGNRDQTY